MNKCIRREVIQKTKTYLYYFNVCDENLVLWLYRNKYRKMENVASCATYFDSDKGMCLQVTYK